MYFNRLDNQLLHLDSRIILVWWPNIEQIWRAKFSGTLPAAVVAGCPGAQAATVCRPRTWTMSRSQCGRLEDSIEVWPIFGHQCVNLSNELKTHSTYLSEPTFARLVKINWSWTFQGVSKLGGRLSGMASGVMSSIQVDIYTKIDYLLLATEKLWNPKHISIQHCSPREWNRPTSC